MPPELPLSEHGAQEPASLGLNYRRLPCWIKVALKVHACSIRFAEIDSVISGLGSCICGAVRVAGSGVGNLDFIQHPHR